VTVRLRLTFSCLLTLYASCAAAAVNDWPEGDESPATGATREFYNGAAELPWDHFMGDWRDQQGSSQGNAWFARAEVLDEDTPRFIEWDVTDLVRQWLAGEFPSQGFFLRAIGGEGTTRFCSREHPRASLRPQLLITQRNQIHSLPATADTFLDESTYRSQGLQDQLRVSTTGQNTLIRFNLASINGTGRVSKAVLRLHTTAQYGAVVVAVFRCQQGQNVEPSEPLQGLAASYPGDAGVGDDPHVLFTAGFEEQDWAERWTETGVMSVIDSIDEDSAREFAPLQGKALRVRIAKGANGALNTVWKYQRESGREPTEAYFRYYLRLANDWNQTLQGGKLPGFSGTYGRAGWGGRRSFGQQGWSARGLFQRTIPAGNPLAGRTPIGTYCYHADMQGNFGSHWLWQIGYRGYLENNRWYAIEQFLKLNTPGEQDGVIRAWVDGRLAFEKTNIRFRHNPKLNIEQVWMNVYHGGTKPSPYDQHVYIDNVVIADKYIGPMRPTTPDR
jgi:hypothetical protein